MVPGGVTEILWHFVGYFHRIEDVMKDRFVYDDGGDPVRPDDYVINLRDNVVERDLEDFDTDKIPFSRWPTSDTSLLSEIRAPGMEPMKASEDSDFDGGALRKSPMTLKPVTQAGGSAEKTITISYNDGSDELLVDIDQINLMDDDDLLHALPGSDITQLRDFDIETTLQELVDSSESQTPESLAITLTDTDSVGNFVVAYDTQTAESGGGENEHSVGPGRYVNGELQEAPEEEPPAAEEPPAPDPAAKGHWAELGGNDATNAALIVDLKEATNTMIVLGDFFKTNAIIQTNAYVDNDQIEVAGGEAGAQIIGGGNIADNIAEFEQHNGIFASVPVMFSGMHWSVDVVEGNFYDINLVFQKNYLSDNDVSVQDTQHSHYEAHLGENEQLNLTQILDGSVKYDLIIVAGDFHGANFIFQYNVLLDSDILKIAANEEAGDAPGQSVSAGENTLLNNAAIITYGDNFFAIPGENLDDILAALESRSGSLDPSQGWHIPGNGSDVLNVLYVTGDYYDINAIWQVNVIADADIAIQLLSQPQPEEGEELTQSASTGGNSMTNDATIVDVGSTSSLVAGGVYQDSILIQADLVTDNNDEKIVYGDPNKLVSEIVAFTGDDEPANNEIELPETGSTDMNGDPLGSILH